MSIFLEYVAFSFKFSSTDGLNIENISDFSFTSVGKNLTNSSSSPGPKFAVYKSYYFEIQ